MFFAATTVVLVSVWLGWITLYLMGGHAWRDAAVGAGVAASATAVLLGVFIPRTYLMAGAMVRDKLAAQLPVLSRDSGITDLAFRDAGRGLGLGVGGAGLGTGLAGGLGAGLGHGLYDSVSLSGAGGLGVARAASPNVYSTRPATPLTIDSYPRYEVPSPHKVTRF